jgi:hypothetical protein
MKSKDLSQIISENPMIEGFSSVDQVAEYIANSSHSILLTGYLLYAYKGDDSIKSVVITTGAPGKLMLSVFYDGYKMLYSGCKLDGLYGFIEEFSKDKKLVKLYNSIKCRFYD